MQGDQAGGFTAATSHEIYTARLFPKEYWNRASFVPDGTGHLVNVDFLDQSKSTWTAKRVDPSAIWDPILKDLLLHPSPAVRMCASGP